MKYLFNKLKLVTSGVIIFSFFMAMTLSSCDMKSNDSDDSETIEVEDQSAVQDSTKVEEEHPSGGDEHPSDSSANGDEHPTE